MQQFDVTQITQISPVAHAQSKEIAQWHVVNGMKIAVEFESADIEKTRKEILGITDVSCLARYGVKGPQAAQWLADHEITIPANANSWTMYDKKTLVLRLGGSEFLLEDQLTGTTCKKLSSDTARVPSVYQVPRSDAAFILSGREVLNLFSELCAIDLSEKSLSTKDVVMTQVAGISATVLRQTLAGDQVYRLWCDGTYGAYMWDVLLEIATELGGGAVGLAQYQN